MKILVINGSPKGNNSITLQTCLYLQKCRPDHEFEILNVGAKIKALEKDFAPAAEAIAKADLLLFSYPVYTFIAPCQLHRFLELLKAAELDLSGKFASQITTSKHFYDVTAHEYIRENCQDLGLKYIRGLSADMEDLLKLPGQCDAKSFFHHLCWSVEQNIYEPFPVPVATTPPCPVTVPAPKAKKPDYDVVIVTDCEADNTQLGAMIQRFRHRLPYQTRIVNIWEYPLRGGCLGCFNCAITGKCIYTDGFDNYLRNEIQNADSIIYAFTIQDHSMGARFKMYDDRQFCNGHRTVTSGMPIGYLVSGNLSKEHNLRTILEARAQVGSNFLAGIATDETDPDNQIDQLAEMLGFALENQYCLPRNFYGVGGMKVFRDLIWLMQGMMKADHKFYKAHGHYDFPQKQWPTMLKMYLVGALLSSEKLKSKMGSAMTDGMLAPYRKVLDKVK